MTKLQKVAGVVALLFSALYNVQEAKSKESIASTETTVEASDPIENVAKTVLGENEEVITFAPPKEVVQEMPDYSKVWLKGKPNFKGGIDTTSEDQYRYARANQVPFVSDNTEAERYVRSGHLIPLSHPFLDVKTGIASYALPETADFIYKLVEDFRAASCGNEKGRLRVNEALRPRTIRLSNSNDFTVHPTGMAFDLRIINLLPDNLTQVPDDLLPRNEATRCYLVLSGLLKKAEADGLADVTREFWKIVHGKRVRNPHFHVVVVVKRKVYFSSLAGEGQDGTGGQD